jgi:N-methylhydantoinase B/oxoprolinase/acetone carboxylase alpha subunit
MKLLTLGLPATTGRNQRSAAKAVALNIKTSQAIRSSRMKCLQFLRGSRTSTYEDGGIQRQTFPWE